MDIWGDWRVDSNGLVVGFRGGIADGPNMEGISGTEGNGLYVARDREFAAQFGEVSQVRFREPGNPLVLGNETLYILAEDEAIMQPPASTDSKWLVISKEAARRSGITDRTWDARLPKLIECLTDVLKERGYDAVLAGTGENQFVVLLDKSLVAARRKIGENKENKMPSTSEKQRKLMGAALACKRGGKCSSKKIRDVAKGMSEKKLREFARKKKAKSESLVAGGRRMIREWTDPQNEAVIYDSFTGSLLDEFDIHVEGDVLY